MLSLAVASLLTAGAFAARPPAYGAPHSPPSRPQGHGRPQGPAGARGPGAPIVHKAPGSPPSYDAPSSYNAPPAYTSAASTASASAAAPIYPTGAPPSYSSGSPTGTGSASAPSSTFPAPAGTANYFALAVNVTGTGSLTDGPYPGNEISLDLASAYTCSQSPRPGDDGYCCSMPIIFSSDYNPYSSNPSTFDFVPSSNTTGAPLEMRQDSAATWSTDYFKIFSAAEADSEGRRPVRQTYCEGEKATPGVGFALQPYEHLVYAEEGANFGSFYVCWLEENIFGPTLFYRSEDQAVPAGCADVVLVPTCGSQKADSVATGHPQQVSCYNGAAIILA